MADLPITSDEGATPVVLNDPTTTANVANVKAGSTASVAGDNALVVALSPNSPVPTGTNKIGQTGVAQASTTSGQSGDLVQGAVTTAAPAYTTAQTSPLSLTLAGALRVDGSGITQPVSLTSTTITGTVTVVGNKTNNNAGPGATNVGVLPALANAASPAWTEGDQVLESVDLSGRQRIRGTLTTNNAAPVTDGLMTLTRIANASAPTYTEGNVVLASCDLSGNTRIIGTKTNNNAAPTTQVGVLPAIANAAAPTWTEGNQVLLSEDLSGNLRAMVVGNVASGVADVGNPVKIGAVYTTPLPVVTSGERVNLQCDPSGRLYIAPTPNFSVSTFGCNAIFTFAAAATDIFTIYGSATKTIKITRIDLDGTATATGINSVVLIKRTTADTGGTPNAIVPTRYDTNTAAATCTLNYYTANPAVLGTPQGTTGILAAYKVTFLAAGVTNTTMVSLRFQENGAGPIVLNSATEGLCINMNAATVAGNSISINLEWTEE